MRKIKTLAGGRQGGRKEDEDEIWEEDLVKDDGNNRGIKKGKTGHIGF